MRDYIAEATNLPLKKYSYNFDEYIRKYLIKTYQPFINGGICLEVGCGNGELTKYIKNNFQDIFGIDPLINTTLENYITELQYDAIIMHNVLEHVEDTAIALMRIKDILKKKGRLFISVPNANAASRQIAVKMELVDGTTCVTPDEYDHGHRRTYTLERLITSLKRNGFSIVASGGVIFKALSNWQMDKAIQSGVISEEYINGCYELGSHYPDLCSQIYVIAEVE